MTQTQKYTLTQWAKIATMIVCTITVVKEIGGTLASLGMKTTQQYLDLKKEITNSAYVNEQQSSAIKTHEERLNRIESKVDANAQKILDNEVDITKIKYHVK